MNVYQLILITSWIICIVGFFRYTYVIKIGRVRRFTRWKDLSTIDFIAVMAAMQFMVVMPICLLLATITR